MFTGLFAVDKVLPELVENVDRDVVVHQEIHRDVTVDADDLAGHVEEWTAGIAGDDGAVGGYGFTVAETAFTAGDNDFSKTQWRFAAEHDAAGVAHGDAPVARFMLGGLGNGTVIPVTLLGNARHAGIGLVIESEGDAFDDAAVLEVDFQLGAGFAGDVCGCQDETGFVNDDAAAHCRPCRRVQCQRWRGAILPQV